MGALKEKKGLLWVKSGAIHQLAEKERGKGWAVNQMVRLGTGPQESK